MSDELQPNIPALRKAVEWAEAQEALEPLRREWYQYDWVSTPVTHAQLLAEREYGLVRLSEAWEEKVSELATECGTAYCVAGYTVVELMGYDAPHGWVETDDGERHVANVAAEYLGIPLLRNGERHSPPEGHLFHGENSAAEIRRIAEDLAGERL